VSSVGTGDESFDVRVALSIAGAYVGGHLTVTGV
jgi:hypothetical protein